MQVYYQQASDVINPDTEMHYAILSSFQNTRFPHRHDFYEFFLLLEGTQLLITNGHTLVFKPGALVLIRPNDIHTRKYITPGNHINIAFSSEIANAMFDYLGSCYPTKELLQAELPPSVLLSQAEKRNIQSRMSELYAVSTTSPQLQRTMLRTLLLDIFVRYFSRSIDQSSASSRPESWLSSVLREMEYPQNIVEGLPALLSLSGRSHEHLCRSFRDALNCTPTEYINDLRLNYAANFLIHSDLKIIDICYNCGFNNLSHFYHLFREKYHQTPQQFRESEGNITF